MTDQSGAYRMSGSARYSVPEPSGVPAADRAAVLRWFRCGRKAARTAENAAEVAAALGISAFPCATGADHWHIGQTGAPKENEWQRAKRMWRRDLAKQRTSASCDSGALGGAE